MGWRDVKLVSGYVPFQLFSAASALSVLMLAGFQVFGLRPDMGVSSIGSLIRLFAGLSILGLVLFQGSRRGFLSRSFRIRDFIVAEIGLVTVFYSMYALYSSLVNGIALDIPAVYHALYDVLIFLALSFELLTE